MDARLSKIQSAVKEASVLEEQQNTLTLSTNRPALEKDGDKTSATALNESQTAPENLSRANNGRQHARSGVAGEGGTAFGVATSSLPAGDKGFPTVFKGSAALAGATSAEPKADDINTGLLVKESTALFKQSSFDPTADETNLDIPCLRWQLPNRPFHRRLIPPHPPHPQVRQPSPTPSATSRSCNSCGTTRSPDEARLLHEIVAKEAAREKDKLDVVSRRWYHSLFVRN